MNIYVGLKLGTFTVIRNAPEWGKDSWYIRCDCGEEILYSGLSSSRRRHFGRCPECCAPLKIRKRKGKLLNLTWYERERLLFTLRNRCDLVDSCLEWTGASGMRGYGRIKIGGKLESVHRAAYIAANGPIPDTDEYHGTVVMHACDNPKCCNPEHLTLGTQRDNVRDMVNKGRARKAA